MRIGIDLGGTKIELAALEETGAIRLRRRVATPIGDYEATIGAVVGLVDEAERELGTRASVGIATPGALSRATSRVKNANSTCLNGRALREDLERRLARPVRVANDANCFALSEAIDGAAAGARVVFGVILGTGVGGGIVVDGRVIEGVNAIAGEWGHNPLPAPKAGDLPPPPCYCGRSGCVETWLSGPGLAADHARHGGEAIGAEQVVARAAAGDPACEATLQRYEERLARALAAVINVLDPEVIVLGGGLSKVDRWYENVPGLWAAHVFSDEVRTRLVPPTHGDSSGVRGAAWLWPGLNLDAEPQPGEASHGPVTLREITQENIDWVGEILVVGEQRFHVASVAKTFWQSRGRPDFWMRAIYAGDDPVGLVTVLLSDGEAYIARLIVDYRHQGRGYGSEAIRLTLAQARAMPGCNRVRLSHVPSNQRVARLYERFGFRHTGVADEDGELEMILELA
jgi:fructokinase